MTDAHEPGPVDPPDADPVRRVAGGLRGEAVDGADFALIMRLLDSPPESFRKQVVTLEPRTSLPYVAGAWADSFVVVVQGEISLVALDHTRLRLHAGALLFLARLDLHSIDNEGDQPAAIVLIARVATCSGDASP